MAEFRELEGKTITKIEGAEVGSEQIDIECADGSRYAMYHHQDCCESVTVEDICGDIPDLIGTPVVLASEESNSEFDPDGASHSDDSFTWTFYRISTNRGTVVLRWLGESNGYYSESVAFQQVAPASA